MCGRFSTTSKQEVLEERFNAQARIPLQPRYNAAPTQLLPVILNTNPKEIVLARWGFLPSWEKNNTASGFINARAESVDDKPAFKKSFLDRRCLVLADGFYEWKKTTEGKIPYRLILEDESIFAFAGLWRSLDYKNKKLATFTIITTKPNKIVAPIHDRMPVILERTNEQTWLSENNKDKLKSYLQPYQGKMIACEISKLINSPAHDTIDVTYPLEKLV